MPLLANVLVTTQRSSYNATTKVTSSFVAKLTAIPAHAEPMDEIKYAGFGADALSSDYVLAFDTGTDIIEQDRITAMVVITDGVTNWPADFIYGGTNEFLTVAYKLERGAVLLPERLVFIKRSTGGGPIR